MSTENVGNRHQIGKAEQKIRTLPFLVFYPLAAIGFVLITWFFFRTQIRTLVDFQTAVELGSWRVVNQVIYIVYALVAAIAAWVCMYKAAPPKISGATINGQRKTYGQLIPKILAKCAVLQIVLFVLALIFPVIRNGVDVIFYHAVRFGIFGIVLLVITGFLLRILPTGIR